MNATPHTSWFVTTAKPCGFLTETPPRWPCRTGQTVPHPSHRTQTQNTARLHARTRLSLSPRSKCAGQNADTARPNLRESKKRTWGWKCLPAWGARLRRVRNVCGLTSHLATTRLTGHSVTLCCTRHTNAGAGDMAWGPCGREGTHLPASLQLLPRGPSAAFP